ncbi:MAG: hypothetical protein COZ66_02285 [Candidatus Huberarchaeum crystalense]|uniref:Uncharacterized protein n=1 Tax=Huberarchaeum crystalense TaxID=2014257 RepID=A0A2G9LJ09_HUBC1|nr:hypothetical protein [archaeon]OIP20832.1 MAG: hypothetical protein AUJ91_00080 [archaeon CG2_30_31_98]PIN66519.1 MAG: hypothetical protein COW69_01760 [Candidatus Huberarchaeum crystalense]NCS98207.1 hypothetical protein [archaeon]PIV13702.1 MAG: hypothetical protein COS45_01430 [Candidatus Huberarchaeum crystalense]
MIKIKSNNSEVINKKTRKLNENVNNKIKKKTRKLKYNLETKFQNSIFRKNNSYNNVNKNNKKIKLYGLTDINKNLYIKIQAIVFILIIGIFVWCLLNEVSKTIIVFISIIAILKLVETYFALTKWSKNN